MAKAISTTESSNSEHCLVKISIIKWPPQASFFGFLLASQIHDLFLMIVYNPIPAQESEKMSNTINSPSERWIFRWFFSLVFSPCAILRLWLFLDCLSTRGRELKIEARSWSWWRNRKDFSRRCQNTYKIRMLSSLVFWVVWVRMRLLAVVNILLVSARVASCQIIATVTTRSVLGTIWIFLIYHSRFHGCLNDFLAPHIHQKFLVGFARQSGLRNSSQEISWNDETWDFHWHLAPNLFKPSQLSRNHSFHDRFKIICKIDSALNSSSK